MYPLLTFFRLISTPCNVLDNSGINEGTYLNENTVDLPWSCDFGFSTDDSDWCGFKNDDLDEVDFVENSGETPTIGTGPPESEASQHGELSPLSRYLILVSSLQSLRYTIM